MNINKATFVVLGVLVIIAIIIWAASVLLMPPKYSAAYLITGDIYFGELVRFPSFGLKNVYTIQVNPETPEAPLSIQRFRNVFWGPEDFVKLNRDNVIWTVKLSSVGQLYQLIRTNPDLVPPPGAEVAPPAATSLPQELPGEPE